MPMKEELAGFPVGKEHVRQSPIPVTAIAGDGIGPEVMTAVQLVLEAVGAPIQWELGEAGEQVFARGEPTGVSNETIASILRTRVVLKGPLATPIGHGGKSANVTLRKLFETFGNIRPVRELPGVVTPFSGRNIDLVVVRENVEDLYAGIEHMQTPSVAQCLKLISRKGSEKVIRLAFEIAVAEGRKRVTCVTKANIMKETEGLFQRVFEEIAREYPSFTADHILVDNAAHLLVRKPESFDVLVTTNLNGDILSDLTSGLVGGLGIAPSSNVGHHVQIFEAVHGSAPDIAGKDLANPTALLLSAVQMLRFLGLNEQAKVVKNALLRTLEDGVRTGDLGPNSIGTQAFSKAVIARLGQVPTTVSVRDTNPPDLSRTHPTLPVPNPTRQLVGADIFVEWGAGPSPLGQALELAVLGTAWTLKIISNRGTVVYPAENLHTDCVDHYRCRFVARESMQLADEDVRDLLSRVEAKHHWMHVEKLHTFDGKRGYSLAQGER